MRACGAVSLDCSYNDQGDWTTTSIRYSIISPDFGLHLCFSSNDFSATRFLALISKASPCRRFKKFLREANDVSSLSSSYLCGQMPFTRIGNQLALQISLLLVSKLNSGVNKGTVNSISPIR